MRKTATPSSLPGDRTQARTEDSAEPEEGGDSEPGPTPRERVRLESVTNLISTLLKRQSHGKKGIPEHSLLAMRAYDLVFSSIA